jgi:DNA polymerase I-like protein with 3'-5' exonuclease and polymerase domains
MSRPSKVPHRLQDVVRRELGLGLDKEHQNAAWGGQLTDGMLAYAATDTQVLLPLVEALRSKAKAADLERACEIERGALPAMAWMANAGLPFDAAGWREHLEGLETERRRLAGQLEGLAPGRPGGESWNWNSHLQIKEVFVLLGVRLPDTKEETLSRVDGELAAGLLRYKKVSTMLSNYGPKLLGFVREDGRIYADWHQIGAKTGRMSCSKPGLQKLPPEVKRHVRAPEGRTLVRADYAQAELRILAKASGEPVLLRAFEAGDDPYVAAAAGMFGVPETAVTKEQRSEAKGVVLSLVYGTTAAGLAGRLGTDKVTAQGLMERFFAAHQKVEVYLKGAASEALRTRSVRSLTGRVRRFGNVAAMGPAARRSVRREAMNFPMQASCADGLKLSLALLWERRGEVPGAVPVACVHDEIVVECDETDAGRVEEWLRQAMIDGMDEALNGPGTGGARVPVEVETRIAKTWAG